MEKIKLLENYEVHPMGHPDIVETQSVNIGEKINELVNAVNELIPEEPKTFEFWEIMKLWKDEENQDRKFKRGVMKAFIKNEEICFEDIGCPTCPTNQRVCTSDLTAKWTEI